MISCIFVVLELIAHGPIGENRLPNSIPLIIRPQLLKLEQGKSTDLEVESVASSVWFQPYLRQLLSPESKATKHAQSQLKAALSKRWSRDQNALFAANRLDLINELAILQASLDTSLSAPCDLLPKLSATLAPIHSSQMKLTPDWKYVPTCFPFERMKGKKRELSLYMEFHSDDTVELPWKNQHFVCSKSLRLTENGDYNNSIYLVRDSIKDVYLKACQKWWGSLIVCGGDVVCGELCDTVLIVDGNIQLSTNPSIRNCLIVATGSIRSSFWNSFSNTVVYAGGDITSVQKSPTSQSCFLPVDTPD